MRAGPIVVFPTAAVLLLFAAAGLSHPARAAGAGADPGQPSSGQTALGQPYLPGGQAEAARGAHGMVTHGTVGGGDPGGQYSRGPGGGGGGRRGGR